VRSPHCAREDLLIDASSAKAMDGVVAIVTGAELAQAGVKPLVQSADFKRADGQPTAAPPQHAMAIDTARFAGEIVAAVLAETREQARDAAEAIDVRYEALPAVVMLADAVAKHAPLVWPEASGNVACAAKHGNADAAMVAIAGATHCVTLDLTNQRVIPAPIEPRATLAELRRGKRPHHAAAHVPDAYGRARRARARSARHRQGKDSRARRRRRRRLRHEDDAL
jgi:carbon-monoxide dehydrogenase large subunit